MTQSCAADAVYPAPPSYLQHRLAEIEREVEAKRELARILRAEKEADRMQRKEARLKREERRQRKKQLSESPKMKQQAGLVRLAAHWSHLVKQATPSQVI
jgi:hypothetical protein